MLKTFGAVAAAAMIATGGTLVSGASGVASTPTPATASQPAPIAAGQVCRGWPYVDPSCLKDAEGQRTAPRPTRMVAIDRL